jgi:diphosphomevalonate decarboxylase
MSTARAYPNIALIKYWGKRDESLHLPTTTSLSMTFDIFPTTTTVTVQDASGPGGTGDTVILDDRPASPDFAGRVSRFLDLVRDRTGDHRKALVHTVNTVPLGAGLASSAAGFAALALAASAAYGLELNQQDLSRLARRGSGSAARSVFGGFVQWHRGTGEGHEGDASSYAEPVDASRLDPALVIALVEAGQKPISSREAMRRTMATSPFYRPWVAASRIDLVEMHRAIAAGDLGVVGEVAERNAMAMHATMFAARPAVRYLTAGSVHVLDRVSAMRARGISAHATMDAGPNVKVLCSRADIGRVAADLAHALGEGRVFVACPGPPAEVLAR